MTPISASVHVTGMGIISAIGQDLASFGRSLAEGKSGIRRIAREVSPQPPVRIGAEIDSFAFRWALDQVSGLPDRLAETAFRIGRRAPLPVQASIVSALQAWQQARLDEVRIPAERIGLVIAGHNTTQGYQYPLFDEFRRNPEYLSPRYAVQVLDSNHLGVLGQVLGIRGEGMVVGGASASGNVGAIQAMRLIQAGLIDACLVVGVMADLSPMEIQAFHSIGAMGGKRFHDQPDKACRPFDTQHEGFIYGQAAACLMLESGPSATAREAASLAVLCGGAIALHGTASTEPDIDGEAQAMRTALRQSGMATDAIRYLNTHGSSSPLGDRVELEAIRLVFGDQFPEIWLNATKSLTGHCLNSAGIVELIACVLQMQGGFLHPNLNLDEPIDGQARFCGGTAMREEVRVAMSNSFGFSGINTSVVLRAGG